MAAAADLGHGMYNRCLSAQPMQCKYAMQAGSRRTLQPIDHIDDASEILGGTTGWKMAGRPATAVAISQSGGESVGSRLSACLLELIRQNQLAI
jgi:hypothetical protein